MDFNTIVIVFSLGYCSYPIVSIVRKIWDEAMKATAAQQNGSIDMGNLSDYFEKNRYNGKYYLGDRVTGTWNKIPFVGTVGNDTLINENEGVRLSIHLDLPIKFKGTVHNMIIANHKNVRSLPEIDDSSSKKAIAPNKKNQ
jgi:Glyoxalase superfamily protein